MKYLAFKSRNKAFTLIECLIALVVISGTLLVVIGATKYQAKLLDYFRNDTRVKWLNFANLMDYELNGASLVKVEADFLYVLQRKDDTEKIVRFGKSDKTAATDFRKTNTDGLGYQPMLFDVQAVEMTQTTDVVRIDITLKKNFRRSYVWYIEGAR
ncbi:MAG: prepilin-type N-terminal cleavage/methylation domain-containing protein [Streptococcaceae bacterium]|jgi:competence protein ComGF|nr:prepilin-type N-terminal cleavage/methylation domain-containing protein [Streptococcaceae bacterium]